MHAGIAYLRWRGKRSRHSRRMRTRNFVYLVRGPWHYFCFEHWCQCGVTTCTTIRYRQSYLNKIRKFIAPGSFEHEREFTFHCDKLTDFLSFKFPFLQKTDTHRTRGQSTPSLQKQPFIKRSVSFNLCWLINYHFIWSMEGIYCKRTDNCEQLELVQNSWDDFYENEDTDVIPARQSEMTSMKIRTQMLYQLVSLRWLLWNWGHRCYTTSSVWDDFYENKDTDVIPARQSEMTSMKIRTQMLYHLVSLRWFLWKQGHRCYTSSSVWDDFYENEDTDVIPARQSEMTSMKIRTQMLYQLVSLRWLLWNWGHRCYTTSSVWDDFYENKDTDVIPARQSEMTSMKIRTQMLYHLVSLRWFLWKQGHRCYTSSSVWDDFYENEDTDVIPPRQSEMTSMKLRTQILYQLVSLRWLLWKWGHRCYTTSSVWDDFYENKDTDVILARQSEMTSMKIRTQMLYHLVSLRWFLWK